MKYGFSWYGLKWEKQLTIEEHKREMELTLKVILLTWFTLLVFGVFWFIMVLQVLGYKFS